jgi:transposase InsO family protein
VHQEVLVPWKEACQMDQRRRFILEWRSGTMSRTVLCQLFGISRQTGYKWVRRFESTKKWTALEERSRRPAKSPSATAKKLVRLILSQRRQFPTWGPVPIRKRLQTIRPRLKWPAASTIGAILKRHGMVAERQRRHRLAPRTRPFSACREPNDVWCVDFKGQFRMGDGRLCYPLTVMDASSRFLLACVAFHSPTLENVRGVFEELFRAHGLPKAMRSDNGEPFASTSTAGGLSQLSVWWVKLGIRLERIDPGKPQQNGRHERMHLTLKIDTCSPPRRSLGWQQRAFDRFRRIYNEERPHQALDLATPASLYLPSSRRLPEELAQLQYPFSDCHRVRADGTIRWRNRNLFISSTLAGELIGLNTLDSRYVQVAFANLLLGVIDTHQPERGLIQPKPAHRRTKTTQLSAMSPV